MMGPFQVADIEPSAISYVGMRVLCAEALVHEQESFGAAFFARKLLCSLQCIRGVQNVAFC